MEKVVTLYGYFADMKKKQVNRSSEWLNYDNIQPIAVYHRDPKGLRVDAELACPLLKNITTDSQELTLAVSVPELNHPVNLYLYANGRKYDLYYNVKPGEYVFKGPEKSRWKIIELFYVSGFRRSSSLLIEQI